MTKGDLLDCTNSVIINLTLRKNEKVHFNFWEMMRENQGSLGDDAYNICYWYASYYDVICWLN